MNLEYAKITAFERGFLFNLLADAYSFDKRYYTRWSASWKEFDTFFFDNPTIADSCGFVSVLSGKPIGFISWNPLKKPDYVEIGHNCIASSFKGNGYGKQQLTEAISRIRKYEGLQKIIVETNSNLVAKFNYESCGFTLASTRANETDSAFSGEYLMYELVLP